MIFREVSRDQLVSDYYLLVLYMSGACSNTSSVGFWARTRANRGHRARSSIPRVLEKSYLSLRERLGGRSTLEQGSTLESLEYARAERAWLCLCSSRASTVVPLLEHAEHESMLCSSVLVHNTRLRVGASWIGRFKYCYTSHACHLPTHKAPRVPQIRR